MHRIQNISNLITEKDGIKILKEIIPQFLVPTKYQLKEIYSICQIPYTQFSRSIDGIILKCSSIEAIKSSTDFLFVEIKTTKSKSVSELPFGVFFGITENEEELFRTQDNYRLCIVHTGLKTHCLLEFQDYLKLIQNKRVQYQVNFKSKK
jgi:hypothetical protein